LDQSGAHSADELRFVGERYRRWAAASSRAWIHPVERLWAPWLSEENPGRVSDTEIRVYKAMGVAMEDMVAANLAYQRARRDGSGGVMVW